MQPVANIKHDVAPRRGVLLHGPPARRRRQDNNTQHDDADDAVF